jgi:prophage regulatory protein
VTGKASAVSAGVTYWNSTNKKYLNAPLNDSSHQINRSRKMNSEFVRLPQVLYLTGLGKTSIYKLMSNNAFPMPISFGTRRIAWRYNDVRLWIKQKIKERDNRKTQLRTYPY